MNIVIRQEDIEDYPLTEEVVKKAFMDEAFSDKTEHILVQRIRASHAFVPALSLVALNERNEIIGHILLSKITIVDGDNASSSLALAPVSVLPDYQHKGIGSQLIRASLQKAKELGFHSVIVLGHQDYYPKFGFQRASLWNIQAPFPVSDEVFMALELTENALERVQGVVHYSAAFLA